MSAKIVEGEASESSDDEFMSTGDKDDDQAKVAEPDPSSGNSSSTADIDTQHITESSDPSDQPVGQVVTSEAIPSQSKYKGLLQSRLVSEMFTLRTQVENIANASHKSALKSLKSMRKGAEANISDLKEADHQIQLLSNDLFRLEDKLDHVFSIDNLHNIRLAE